MIECQIKGLRAPRSRSPVPTENVVGNTVEDGSVKSRDQRL